MALNLFTQKDIERIDINEIPEEFINYFDDLNNIEKQRISDLRPDLTAALGYKETSSQISSTISEETEEEADEESEFFSIRILKKMFLILI